VRRDTFSLADRLPFVVPRHDRIGASAQQWSARTSSRKDCQECLTVACPLTAS
jgi:hypothetical protein